MALFNVPVSEEVSEVAKDGEDAVAHVREHSDPQGSLFERFHKWLLVQAGIMVDILVLKVKQRG